jgi:hypothetical protein
VPFHFLDLDTETRRFMVEEIEAAVREGNLYYSKRFGEAGAAAWPQWLLAAARQHNEHWLAFQIEVSQLMKGLEGSRTAGGGYTVKHVPQTAAETLAEGQFNRYYILALCRRACASGKREVVVYRAKMSLEPQAESAALIGRSLDAEDLAEQIRSVKSSLGHTLLRPNSGLSVHL